MAEYETDAPAPKSKTAFVLEQPSTMSAKEIAARAKEAGLEIAANYVYVIRNNQKKRETKGTKPTAARTRAPKPSLSPSAAEADVDERVVEALRSAAYILGLPRAITILRDERDRIQSRFGVDPGDD